MTELARTNRSRVKRLPKRGGYDFETVAAILDAGFLCHVGYVIEGDPYVTPTSYWREGDHVYWHGSSVSRMLRTLEAGTQACLTVAHIDGLVLARSGFHHSINYRSVMLFGRAHAVESPADKERALQNFVERLYPGRWNELRPVNRKELNATTVLHMKIDEGAAKVRTGPPIDDAEDYDLPIWAGVLPVRMHVDPPVADDRLNAAVPVPEYLADLAHVGLKRS